MLISSAIIYLTKAVQYVGDEHKFAGVELNHRHVSKQLGTLCKYESILQKKASMDWSMMTMPYVCIINLLVQCMQKVEKAI